MSDQTLVGLWDLLGTNDITATNTFPIRAQPLQTAGGESSLFNDHRVPVTSKDFGPGGKYQCVIKLQLRYEKQDENDARWAMGTGWLIRPGLLVTAGHCAYDWEHGNGGLGRVVRVKAYKGYNGKASTADPRVQFRQGSRVATTAGWLRGASNESSDVSFIQLETPFDIKISDCISYVDTPLQGSETLGVVGYPADKSDEQGEKGAQMYQEFDPVSYDLTKKSNHMLHYEISTYAGQSGSPVLRQSNGKALEAIGTHVLGLGDKNAASPIGGKFGNPYKDYLAVFDRQNTVVNSLLGVTFVRVPATNPINGGRDGIPGIGGTSLSAEGFFDLFQDVIKIGGKIVPDILIAGTPFLGPIGGPIAGIAGTILSMAGKMAESAMGIESSMHPDDPTQFASRAILGEAALQHVLSMDHETVQELGLLDAIRTIYTKTLPFVEKIAPKILPIVAEPALRIALDSIRKMSTKKNEFELPPTPRRIELPESSFETSPEIQAFLRSLTSRPIPVAAGQEGFFDINFKSVLSQGLSVVGFLQSSGLLNLKNILGQEDAMPPTESEMNLILLSKRAAMGEAALQALMMIPKEKMDTEGFFDRFTQVAGTIGDQILKSAPAVIRAATPIVMDLWKGQFGVGKASASAIGATSFTTPLRGQRPISLIDHTTKTDGTEVSETLSSPISLKSKKSMSLQERMEKSNGTEGSADANSSARLGTDRRQKNLDGLHFAE